VADEFVRVQTSGMSIVPMGHNALTPCHRSGTIELPSHIAQADGARHRGDSVGLFEKKKQPETTPTDAKVYYSTPFGDTKDGKQKLFLLERDGVRYVPVFRSVESMKEFYDRMNRAGYMILEGDVKRAMDTNRSIELMQRVGIVIEPLSDHPVEIMPDS
jgi:hypothetical protein